MHTQHQQQWELYTSAWKADTESEKRAILEKSLVQDCVYSDPLTVAEGVDALVAYMLEFHTSMPGGHFVTREFKTHNNRSISEWNMCAGDGSVVGVGISYGEYNATGKLVSMTGFFDVPDAG